MLQTFVHLNFWPAGFLYRKNIQETELSNLKQGIRKRGLFLDIKAAALKRRVRPLRIPAYCFRFLHGPGSRVTVIPGEDPESKRICDMIALDSCFRRNDK